jgi:TPP-dependent pyruvate/acetoin dehydrogenase alpha subunit
VVEESEQLVELYRQMLVIRKFEVFIRDHHSRTSTENVLFHGMTHLSIGQEATAVGACAALSREDYIATTYRNHAPLLAKGADPGKVLAEIMGRRNGYNRGKGGSMHVTAPDVGSLGSFATVGMTAAVAVGAAYAAIKNKNGRVALAFFGDGAINTGILAESFNLAAVWKCPVIFFCENNQFAITTRTQNVVPLQPFSARATAHGIAAVHVDGCDVIDVYEATRAAVARARDGQGPTYIEARTHRLVGHMVGERFEEQYRARSELDRWKGRDPIVRFPEVLRSAYDVTPETLVAVERSADEVVKRAIEYSMASELPAAAEVETDVFAPSPEGLS